MRTNTKVSRIGVSRNCAGEHHRPVTTASKQDSTGDDEMLRWRSDVHVPSNTSTPSLARQNELLRAIAIMSIAAQPMGEPVYRMP